MKSPCIQVCKIDDAARLCTGCYRTLDEIAGWSSYSDQQRDRILADLPKRRLETGRTG